MGIIREEVIVSGEKDIKKVEALIDTGASDVYINNRFAESIGAVKLPLSKLKGFTATDEVDLDRYIIKMNIQGCRFPAMALGVDKLREDLIIGVNFFQESKAVIDFEDDKLRIRSCPKEIIKERRL